VEAGRFLFHHFTVQCWLGAGLSSEDLVGMQNGVTEDPEELRKLYKDRGYAAIGRFSVQLLLDALACFAVRLSSAEVLPPVEACNLSAHNVSSQFTALSWPHITPEPGPRCCCDLSRHLIQDCCCETCTSHLQEPPILLLSCS
jgi:hypothetical protein